MGRSRNAGLRSFLAPVDDPARGWSGARERADRRVVRYGSCEFRTMATTHGLVNPVGYPAVAVAELQALHGIHTSWHGVFVPYFESLPGTSTSLHDHLKLDGVPDVVVLQVGSVYASRSFLGAAQPVVNLRNQLAHRAPPLLARAHYAAVNSVAGRFGRPPFPYAGAERLDAFFGAVRDTWPDASVFTELPLLPVRDGLWSRSAMGEIRGDIARKAFSWGVEVVDHEERLGTSRALRSLNNYNLTQRGSEIVGAFWADRLAREWGCR